MVVYSYDKNISKANLKIALKFFKGEGRFNDTVSVGPYHVEKHVTKPSFSRIYRAPSRRTAVLSDKCNRTRMLQKATRITFDY